jgi:hypothetical protein
VRPQAFDAVAVALAGVLAVMALTVGLRTGLDTVDVDEAVYLRTLWAMQDGEGYYDAMSAALVQKEGAPPSQIRSVRPPTLFLALAPFPEGAWRWLSGGIVLATLLMAWRVARAASPVAGPLAVVLVGVWMLTAFPLLFLHAELWGLPLVLGGVLAVRDRRFVLGAGLLAGAVVTRELYLVYLVGALIWVPARKPFVVALGALGILGAVHVALTSRILDPAGREADFGNEAGWRHALTALSPAGGPTMWAIGVVCVTVGLVVLVRARRGPHAVEARVVLSGAVPLLVAATTIGRTYWTLTFAPILACYAAMAVGGWGRPEIEVGSLESEPVDENRSGGWRS